MNFVELPLFGSDYFLTPTYANFYLLNDIFLKLTFCSRSC